MNVQIKPNARRFITVAEYRRMTGLSYKTVMNMIRTGQITYIKTESGKYKIDTLEGIKNENLNLYDELNETKQLVKALCKQFNTTV